MNLWALIPRGGLSEGVVVHLMRALFPALRIAHGNRRGNSEANVVHGDLRPEDDMHVRVHVGVDASADVEARGRRGLPEPIIPGQRIDFRRSGRKTPGLIMTVV